MVSNFRDAVASTVKIVDDGLHSFLFFSLLLDFSLLLFFIFYF